MKKYHDLNAKAAMIAANTPARRKAKGAELAIPAKGQVRLCPKAGFGLRRAI